MDDHVDGGGDLSDDGKTNGGRLLLPASLVALAVVYVVLRWGIPWLSVFIGFSQRPAPVPAFAIAVYMMCATVGVLIYVSREDERWNHFLAPLVKLFVIPAGGPKGAQRALLVVLPLLVGWIAWQRIMPSTATPTGIRVQHPALPDQYVTMENPYRDVSAEEREVLEREGVVLYQKNCRPCHGTTADGNGPLARGQRLQPVDFTDPGTIGTVIEPHPFWRITEGSIGLPAIATPWNSAMPPWGEELTPEEIWKIILAEYRLGGIEPREPEEPGG